MTLNKRTLYFSLFVAVITQISLIILYFYTFSGPWSLSQDVWGQFGDYVGGVMNPIVGLFTLFIVAHAYLLQHKELGETKQALQASADANIIKSKIDIETALLHDAIGKCDRISADIQRVTDTPVGHTGARVPTYTFSGDNLAPGGIPTYIKGRRSIYGNVRDEVKVIKSRLEALQKELISIRKVA